MKRGNAEAFVSQHAGASQAATGNEDWRKHNRWASLVTLAVPSTAAQLWPSLILLGMVIWHGDLAGDLGFWVSLWLIWGLFHQDFAIELRVQNPDAFIPWAILFPFNLISAIYS
jgi:hypothetical protein